MELLGKYFWLLNLPVLLAVFWQDLKQRAIYWWLPLPVLLVGLAFNYSAITDKFIPSLILVALHIAFIYLYFFIKNKFKNAYINQEVLGLGDVLMLLSFSPYFNPVEMLVFVFGGMLFSILAFIAIRAFKPHPHTVPLAGFICLFFLIYYPLAVSNNYLNICMQENFNFMI